MVTVTTADQQIFGVEDLLKVFNYQTAAGLRAAIRRGQLPIKFFRRGKTMMFHKSAVEEALAVLYNTSAAAWRAESAAEKVKEAVRAQAALSAQGSMVRDEAEDMYLAKYARKQAA